MRLDRERPQLTTAEARALYPPEDCLLDRNMTMPQLEECGSGEHGKGKKKHRCSDLRRRIDVWTSSDAAELGAMYPCCKRCNEMANERGVTSELIALFMAYHRACQEVEKLERGVL